MIRPLYVVKIGSSTLFLESSPVFEEICALSKGGARVLVVAGGAEGIDIHFRSLSKAVLYLELPNGDRSRYCSAIHMKDINDAYLRVTLPAIEARFRKLGLSVFSGTASSHRLVTARLRRPLKAKLEGRMQVVRDHLVGDIEQVDVPCLSALLNLHDIVVLSPPVADIDSDFLLNVDADMLAAVVANSLRADHLRFVTSTSGILEDIENPTSTLREVFQNDPLSFVRGRMKQKVRAAETARSGTADIAITGPHKMGSDAGTTWFWKTPQQESFFDLLCRAIEIPSVSGDEGELVRYLARKCQSAGIRTSIDSAGNLVAEKGDVQPKRSLMLLGHVDTVPFLWTPTVTEGAQVNGRGAVDAKGSLIAFIAALAQAEVPAGMQLRVVGAVEEEVSSSKGAYFVRDHYKADAVIVGEPSGAAALTIGYFGLFKIQLDLNRESSHTAAGDQSSPIDALIHEISVIRARITEFDPTCISSVISMSGAIEGATCSARAIVNFRLSPTAPVALIQDWVSSPRRNEVALTVLRLTPGHRTDRSSTVVRAFSRAFMEQGVQPKYLLKKGTSDMNTLATTWNGIPMAAYGPGDSSLDHTPRESLSKAEFNMAVETLSRTIRHWFKEQHAIA